MTIRGFQLRFSLPLVGTFLLLLLALGGSVLLFLQQQRAASLVRHTLEVQRRLGYIHTLTADAVAGQRGYILTGGAGFLEPYQKAVRAIEPKIGELAKQISDNPSQYRSAKTLAALVRNKMAELKTSVYLRSVGREEEAIAIVNEDPDNSEMNAIRGVIGHMADTEKLLLEQRSTQAAHYTWLAEIMLLASFVLIFLNGGLVVRDARRRVAELADANRRLLAETGERAAAENQIHQMQKMESVGQLTGGIAHDFNNMLAIVIGSLDLARRRLTGDEHPNVARCIDNASEGAERAAVLTARLLAFSRRQPLAPKILDANKLVGGMSELLRRTIGEPIRVETVLAGGLWRIHADPAQIENALVNLAVNARDAMPEGGQLTIETGNAHLDERYARSHEEVKPGQYVLLSVTDTGVGMPADVIDRAFEPFYTTKGVGKGTGLGLSQVFGFVKQSGGHIKIYSEIGHGTTIKIYLPRHAGDEELDPSAERRGATPLGTPEDIILVVEDEPKVRHMSVEALRELGYTVIPAASPSEALQHLKITPGIALLFTDIVMPEMTGRQLAEKALAARPDLKVLYTTGYTSNAVVHGGVLDPGTQFLPKPFSFEQLAFKIREVLDHRVGG